MFTSSKTTLYMCTLAVNRNRLLIKLAPWTAINTEKQNVGQSFVFIKWDSNLEKKCSIIHSKYKTTTTQMKTTLLGIWFNLLSSCPKSQNCFAWRKKNSSEICFPSVLEWCIDSPNCLMKNKIQTGYNTRLLRLTGFKKSNFSRDY